MRTLHVLSVMMVVAACVPIEPKPGPDDGFDGGVDGGGVAPKVFTAAIDGGTAAKIDATHDTDLVAVDLDTSRQVDAADVTWDLRFRRFRIQSNGGVTGDGGVEVAPLAGATFDAVTQWPDGGWAVDAADGDDPNQDIDSVFENVESWFAYDLNTHVLSPRPVVYVVHTTERRYFKVVIDGYYDQAGTPAVLSVRWAELKSGQ